MENKEFDNWSDDIDIDKLNNEGIAILKRKYVKDGDYIEKYLTYPNKAKIVAIGICAYLFSNSYYGGKQLKPFTFSEINNDVDLVKYFENYFEIRKKFALQILKNNPKYINKDIMKMFLLNHIKEERKNNKNLKLYFSTIDNKEERVKRKKYVHAYIEWIKNKRNPLRAKNYYELFFLSLICFVIVCTVIFEFFWIDMDWNYVQRINKLYTGKDELSKKVIICLIPIFLGLFSVCFKRVCKILNTYKRFI
ncbi:MAG: hypothetical protein WCP69_02730 [Bacteroidota bacterium]